VIPEVKSDYRPKMASVDATDPKKKRIIAVTFDSTITRPEAHEATTNTFKTRLDRPKFWHNHDIIYNFGHSCKELEVVTSFSMKNLSKLSTSTSPLQ